MEITAQTEMAMARIDRGSMQKNTRRFTQCTFVVLLVFVVAAANAQDRDRDRDRPSTSIVTTGVFPTPGFSTTGFGSGAAVPIGAGDLIEMTVFDTPELTGKLRVSNTGDIFIPLVGSMHVQGLKAEAAQTLIRQKLIDGGFLKDPQVTVFVAEYATQGVAVVGEVRNPGIYPAFGSHRLLDYLSVAQGLTSLAGTRITITHAGHPDEQQQVKIEAGATPTPENNPEIQPGDTIYVERTGLVYVIGDVFRPGGFAMQHDQHLTILQAVALAQGTLPTAAKGSVKIIRTTPQGREEIPINLNKVLSAKSDDQLLQDNDILFVPGSTTKGVLKGVQSALPAASAASVYRIP
jgi:polysaccharide biosynthesis/export protein